VPIKINNPSLPNPRVLVAPLDWGLGHATRCIPIIKELLNQKCQVFVASSGAQRTLLQEEFPALTFLELPGYSIKYDKNRALTIFRLLRSIPKILIRIKRENAWLRHFVAREEPDLVISDNRYGLAAPGVFCVFVTHQLVIKTPWGTWADRFVQSLNYRLIRRFSRCWVPDTEAGGLAGALSHPRRMPPVPTRYIGWLSRFGGSRASSGARIAPHPVGGAGVDGVEDGRGGEYLLVLLSGPEPQRTLFEAELLGQARELGGLSPKGQLVLLRGLPGGGEPLPGLPAWVTCYDHLPARELESLILGAALVVARAGYSTVMDLSRLGKRALLVPTPGQTEQEYLGAYLAGKGWAVCADMRAFSLSAAFELATAGSGQPGGRQALDDPKVLASEIRDVLDLVQSGRPALG
jgi:Glycosyltransferase family 28 C-terminal domain